MVFTRISQPWRYRLSLLISVWIAFAYWLVLLLFSVAQISWVWIVLAVSGALVGSLIMTRLREPLWEDNSPPSVFIRAEVQKRHLDLLGASNGSPDPSDYLISGLALVGLMISAPIWLIISISGLV